LKEISKLPQKPTIKQQLKIASMRSRLAKEVKTFVQSSSSFLPTLRDEDLEAFQIELIDTPADESVQPQDPDDFSLDDNFYYDVEAEDDYKSPSDPPESIILPLPSNIISVRLQPSLKFLISIERELRKGQANDALEGIRIGLAHKSLLLLNDVNKSTSTKTNTRAWASVRNCQGQILHHDHAYQRAWRALESIGTPEDHEVYQKLEEKDLVIVKDITKSKRFGQGSYALAWFWRIGPSEGSETGEWMEKCERN
jgi:hypothetical protein